MSRQHVRCRIGVHAVRCEHHQPCWQSRRVLVPLVGSLYLSACLATVQMAAGLQHYRPFWPFWRTVRAVWLR
jgi:hypothetical protein